MASGVMKYFEYLYINPLLKVYINATSNKRTLDINIYNEIQHWLGVHLYLEKEILSTHVRC